MLRVLRKGKGRLTTHVVAARGAARGAAHVVAARGAARGAAHVIATRRALIGCARCPTRHFIFIREILNLLIFQTGTSGKESTSKNL